MKKIMLAAVAASFMSTGAQAVQLPAEGEVCSSIHSNISVGINNPELSDYRKCVMIQHEIDTAFTYKTFWVRTGTEFTSFPVETLAKMSRSERIDYMMLAIQRGVVVEALTAERDALMIERDDLIERLTDKAAHLADTLDELEEANKMIANLTEALEAAGRPDSIVKLEGFEEGRIAGAASREAEIANLTAARDTAVEQLDYIADTLVKKGIFSTKDAALGIITDDDQGFAYALSKAERHILNDVADTLGVSKTYSDNWGTAIKSAERLQADIIAHIETQALMTINAEDILKSARASALASEPTIVVYAYDLDIYPTRVVVKGGVFTSATLINGFDNTIPADLAETVEEAFKQGYSDGFEDGYEQGYADGYSDGFTDGVNSVK